MDDWKQAGFPGPNSGVNIPTAQTDTSNTIYKARDQVIITPKVAYGQLQSSATAMYTAPTLTSSPTGSSFATALIYAVTLCNTDSSARTYTLYRVESGGTAANNRKLTAAISLAIGETVILEWQKGMRLYPGDSLQGLSSSADKITYVVDVDELTQ